MRIECVKEKLHRALSLVDRVSGKNLTLPILGCVLLEAKDKTLLLRATNLELGIEAEIPAKVESEGAIAIPAGVLTSFISQLSGEKGVFLDFSKGNLSVSFPGSATVIKCYNPQDFPTIPKISGDHVFSIPSEDLVRGLKSVWYSASISSMKQELSSVYIYPDSEWIVFVATDSFRLAEKKIKAKHQKNFPNVLIPFKNVSEIIRIAEVLQGDVEIHVTKNQISFFFEGLYLTSRIIEGSFPDYRQIIPKEFKTELVLLKQDLERALKLAVIFSDSFNQVGIKSDNKRKEVEFKTKNDNVGENTSSVSAAISGETLDLNFNHRYMSESLPFVPSDSVSLSFNGSGKPMVIRGVSDRTFTYLVMPMNK